jgi:GT2 family glycosyltransferase
MTGAITVVIPVYGPGPHLEEVVATLDGQLEAGCPIIISHSGEGDPSARFAGHDRVTVLHSDERLFAGAARNRGLAEARTDWVAFIDEDIVPTDGWYDALRQSISEQAADCIIGAIDYRESSGYWGTSLWYTELGSVHPYMPKRPMTGGPSGNMAVRRAAFAKTGGFPDDWRSSEELVGQARMIAAGHKLIFDPAVIVYHYNLRGAGAVFRHLYLYGRFGARLRRAYPFLPGALAVRQPILSLGMWLARLGQMTKRVMMGRGSRKLHYLLHLPGIIACLVTWNLSFTREAFQPDFDRKKP